MTHHTATGAAIVPPVRAPQLRDNRALFASVCAQLNNDLDALHAIGLSFGIALEPLVWISWHENPSHHVLVHDFMKTPLRSPQQLYDIVQQYLDDDTKNRLKNWVDGKPEQH